MSDLTWDQALAQLTTEKAALRAELDAVRAERDALADAVEAAVIWLRAGMHVIPPTLLTGR